MVVGSGCICMDPAKLSAIATWSPPKTIKEIWSFLGFCNFYQKFIPSFSNIIITLTVLMWTGQPWHWDAQQQTTFNILLQKFQTAPVLHLPNICHPFTIMTDVSLLASGGVLMQTNDNGDLHPCIYLSQTFSLAECNYDIYDHELLAVIHALNHWWQYLQGMAHPVTLLTDHKNLTYFCQPQKPTWWQACWMLFLQDFNLIFWSWHHTWQYQCHSPSWWSFHWHYWHHSLWQNHFIFLNQPTCPWCHMQHSQQFVVVSLFHATGLVFQCPLCLSQNLPLLAAGLSSWSCCNSSFAPHLWPCWLLLHLFHAVSGLLVAWNVHLCPLFHCWLCCLPANENKYPPHCPCTLATLLLLYSPFPTALHWPHHQPSIV